MFYFIVNLSGGSGNARRTWQLLRRQLKENHIPYKAYPTMYEKHASVLAAKISSLPDEEIPLIIVGGDGTINEVLNGIVDFHKVILGVIPTGSGNDFARGLQLSPHTLDALKLLWDKRSRLTMDLGKVTYVTDNHKASHYFGISSGIGLDAIVCKKVETSALKKWLNRLHLGNLSYTLMTVYTLFSMEKYDVSIDITDEEGKCQSLHYSDLIFLAGMNFSTEGGGVCMAPSARSNDGLISLCAANGLPKWRAFFMLFLLIMGKHAGHKGIHLKNARSLTLNSRVPMVLHADGEYLGDVTYIKMETIPNALRVFAPCISTIS